MNPARDLGAVARLIADAFADELDQRGKAALREMRWMARLSPLVWWWSQADPAFCDTFNGFVWEEPSPKGRGRIVGNVSLSRTSGSRLRWVICNVVVQTEYRGQGIGQQLVDAAIAEARDLGAVGVILQVDEANPPALRLYLERGFREVAGEVDLHLQSMRSVAVLDAPGYQGRAWSPDDGETAHELALLVTPPALQWLKPLRANEYRLNRWNRLGRNLADMMAGRRVYRLVMLKDGRLVALLTLSAAFRQGDHQLELLVHPDHRGHVEAALISRGLHMLATIPPKPVAVTVDKEHQTALAVLRNYGFETKRTLLTLRRDF